LSLELAISFSFILRTSVSLIYHVIGSKRGDKNYNINFKFNYIFNL